MAVMVIFGGTTEGRKLAQIFAKTNVRLHVCVATEYGASLLPEGPLCTVHTGRLDEEAMEHFLREIKPDYCVDATHPYAVVVTDNLVRVCEKLAVPYIRIFRDSKISDEEGICRVDSVEAAVAFLKEKQGRILITTGSKELHKYTAIEDYKNRCVARVLPTAEVLEKCNELGFEGKNLIAMQGPFSEELNYEMMVQAKAKWVVTKESGREGGYQEKCEAALRAGAGLVIIGRPAEPAKKGMEFSKAAAYLKERFHLSSKRTLFLIGMGMGDEGLLTKQAGKCLEDCDVIIGASRIVKIWPGYAKKPCFMSYHKDEIQDYLKLHQEYEKIALVYSGDMGFYSGARNIEKDFPEYEIEPVPGVASPVYFLDRLLLPWENVYFTSCHGQKNNLAAQIMQNKAVCTLLGETKSLAQISEVLCGLGMNEVKITIGERLSYPEERIVSGYPQDFLNTEWDTLSVALFQNPKPTKAINDDEFIRDRVPMTKQETRILSLAKLDLSETSVVYDVGAGTGAMSIEMAMHCSKGTVYAIEKKAEAAALLESNRKKFGAWNLQIVEGEAPDCFEGLPAPTHVFVGGSGGRLSEIIGAVQRKNPMVKIVLNVVTLETMAQVAGLSGEPQVIQTGIAKSRRLGGYHIMQSENPVYIVTLDGGRESKDA